MGSCLVPDLSPLNYSRTRGPQGSGCFDPTRLMPRLKWVLFFLFYFLAQHSLSGWKCILFFRPLLSDVHHHHLNQLDDSIPSFYFVSCLFPPVFLSLLAGNSQREEKKNRLHGAIVWNSANWTRQPAWQRLYTPGYGNMGAQTERV